jgi:hypothetical protein
MNAWLSQNNDSFYILQMKQNFLCYCMFIAFLPDKNVQPSQVFASKARCLQLLCFNATNAIKLFLLFTLFEQIDYSVFIRQ